VIDDHAVVGFEAGKHDAIAVDLGAERNTAILGLIALTYDKDEALALIIADGTLRHNQRVIYRANAHAH